MRQGVLLAVVAACGGGTGSGDGPPGQGDGPPVADAPPVGTPLVDRLAVSDVAAVGGVAAGGSVWRIWGTGNLRVSPVYTVPYGCGTLVGYTTADGTAHVAQLDAADHLITTFDVGGFRLRGLAAEPDGHFAALLWDQGAASLHVTRFDATGAAGWTTSLDDPLAAPTDFGIGESRLEYGDGKYGAYFHVHGISGFANGHEGDAEHWVTAATGAHSLGWDWGCSHSMSELLRFDPANRRFLAMCVTDCYPGTPGDFATTSIGGVYADHARKVIDVDGACNGNVAGELGGMAPSGPGWRLVWNSHRAPATPGQGSYAPATMNQDVGFATLAPNGAPSAIAWLTDTPGVDESDPSIAAWHPSGDPAEQYVVGWRAPGGGGHYLLTRVAADGAVLEGPVDVTAVAAWGQRDDPFRAHANGDVIWAWFDAAGASTFHVARLRAGGSCAP